MNHAERLLACAAAALLSFCTPAQAERADRDKPVHIEADSVRMDDLQRIAVYEGKVILTQGTLRVQADRVEVRQDAEGFLTGTALGKPVHFRQRLDGRGEWVDAWANRVEYDARKEQVRLIGEAFLKKGEEELRGDIITYDARSELYQASGGLAGQKPGRVRAVIMPFKDGAVERARREGRDEKSGVTVPPGTRP
jgi:lipopolysaccharide export system protein LptA